MPDGFITASRSAPNEVEQGFDLRETLSFIWRQWKFIAAITIVVFLVGTVFLVRETPLYTATSQVLIDRQREKTPGGDAILSDISFADVTMLENQMAIIR